MIRREDCGQGEDIWREQCFHQRPEGVQFNHFNTNQGAFEIELAFKDAVRGDAREAGAKLWRPELLQYCRREESRPGSHQRVALKKKAPH